MVSDLCIDSIRIEFLFFSIRQRNSGTELFP